MIGGKLQKGWNPMRLFVVACALLGVLNVASAQAPAPAAPKAKPDPRNVQLVGNRFKALKWDEMTPEQRAMLTNIVTGERGGAGGPFNVMLRNPEMGDLAQKLGAQARFHSELPDKLRELAILITARYWTSQYEWQAHRRAAEQAGLSKPIIEAIATGKRPAGMSAEEEVIYNFGNELMEKRGDVSDATFQAAVKMFGERRVVNVINIMGYYSLVSMLLNADRHPMPGGAAPELKPLK
jgi:4-carboxymuconolactone decarboxylase